MYVHMYIQGSTAKMLHTLRGGRVHQDHIGMPDRISPPDPVRELKLLAESNFFKLSFPDEPHFSEMVKISYFRLN